MSDSDSDSDFFGPYDGFDDLLTVLPTELNIPIDFNEEHYSCSIQLTNKTDRTVAYQFWPSWGIHLVYEEEDTNVGSILPRSTSSVTVTVKLSEKEPPPEDKVYYIEIYAFVVKDGVKAEDITSENLHDLTDTETSGFYCMPVVYYYSTVVPAANPSSAVPDMANSPSSSRLPPASSDENNDFLSEENINSGGKKKRTRGKTKVPVVAIGEKNRTMIEWNDYGQPVGKESDGFSTTVGFLVRENVPININTWHSVNQIIKERLCDLIMEKYAIENRHKKYILRLMGKLWRNWKSSLSRSIRKVVEDGVDISQHITSLKPNETSDREWDEFVKIRTSDKFKFPGEPSNGRALPSPSSRETRQESVTDSATTNLINAKCNLLNWTASGQVVAKAEIAATDSTSMVHHVILGPDCYKVWVKEVLVPDIILFRASKEFFTLNDAIGSTIAWPHKYISFEENQVNTNRLLSS